MPQVSSLREPHRDGSTTRLAVTLTGDVSPAERVDALAIFEQLSRDAGQGVRCARFRIEARVQADGLSTVDGIMILEDGRALFGWSVDRTMLGAARDVSRRLRARMYAAARRPALDETA
ncbi:MAG: hypothetical protein QOH28_2814 [Actinomycetota bacterium]|nr:hypothetical protein [Actinomycetota bacterium]